MLASGRMLQTDVGPTSAMLATVRLPQTDVGLTFYFKYAVVPTSFFVIDRLPTVTPATVMTSKRIFSASSPFQGPPELVWHN